MEFAELGLAQPILEALRTEGYTTPTPIQAQAIPAILAGSDLLGIAQTGTGKTAAFALPMLTRFATNPVQLQRRHCRALVLSPTRELASQIAESFRVYGHNLGLTVAVVFGGVAMKPQVTTLSRGVDILVATPGRLLDHIGERTVVLSSAEVLVLDEVDQMLDLGFIKPIRRIVQQMSLKRQNLFFSATMPSEIAKLADELLVNPIKISVAPVATTAERVAQRVIHVEAKSKNALLADLAADPAMARTLVFTRTKRGADRVAKYLVGAGVVAAAIHGNKSQRQREDALYAFRRGKTRILVATDIAARGIDVDAVTHVVNYELPEVPEAYVHRIGRTARAGATGLAISFCCPDEREKLRAIEKLTRQTIPSEDRRGQFAPSGDAEPASRGRPDRRDARAPDRKRPHAAGDDRRPARTGGSRPDNRRGDASPARRDTHGANSGANSRASEARPWSNHGPRSGENRGDDRRPTRSDDRGHPGRTERGGERRGEAGHEAGRGAGRGAGGAGRGSEPREERPWSNQGPDRGRRDGGADSRGREDRHGDRRDGARPFGPRSPDARGERPAFNTPRNGSGARPAAGAPHRDKDRDRDGGPRGERGRTSGPRSGDDRREHARPAGARPADRSGSAARQERSGPPRGDRQDRPQGARTGARPDSRPGSRPAQHQGRGEGRGQSQGRSQGSGERSGGPAGGSRPGFKPSRRPSAAGPSTTN